MDFNSKDLLKTALECTARHKKFDNFSPTAVCERSRFAGYPTQSGRSFRIVQSWCTCFDGAVATEIVFTTPRSSKKYIALVETTASLSDFAFNLVYVHIGS